MADTDDSKNTNGTPKPEVLKPQDEHAAESAASEAKSAAEHPSRHLRRGTYRPSHKATFIGLVVVVLILGINAGAIAFVLKGQSNAKSSVNSDQVTINQSALDKLGVSRSSVADAGVQLTVGPAAKFNNGVSVGGDLSIAGQLVLNNKFSAQDASLAQLEAGNTSLQQLNVNGTTSLSTAALRGDMQVNGTSRFQGAVVMSQLLTVNSNMNVAGSLSVGGALTVSNFHASSLAVDSTLTLGGHVITRGYATSFSKYSSPLYGSNGTASISGNDMAGTIGINVGAGSSGSGCLGHVTFRNGYGGTPHVILTAQGPLGYIYTRDKNSAGFDVCAGGVNGVGAGGYTIDYIVEE